MVVPVIPGSKAQQDGWTIQIIADHLHIKPHADLYANTVVLGTSSNEPLSVEFAKLSGLKQSFSNECLSGANWNIDAAMNVFEQAKVCKELFISDASSNIY